MVDSKNNPCPYVYPLLVISRKWSYVILRSLRKKRSFSQLNADLKYITNRILSRELKRLQDEDLIVSKDGYLLTEKGKSLLAALEPLSQWSIKVAGKRECPQGLDCSCCESYGITVGARGFKK